MELEDKINRLGDAARFDLCGSCGPKGTNARRLSPDKSRWIYPTRLPDGRSLLLLKVLLSNSCLNHCYYCATSAWRKEDNARFQPDELAGLFLSLYARGSAHGLFLSSAIPATPQRTMDELLSTVEILRLKHRFSGYIHLKVLPGAERNQVERAVELASRVSINLEAPSADHLRKIAPGKDFQKDLLEKMKWIKEVRQAKQGDSIAGCTTQFVIGASSESDLEILSCVESLYRNFNLTRAYFSAFYPIPDTPLAQLPPTPPLREHRLYQADFLLRSYGFNLEDLTFEPSGNLSLEADPKMAWARIHPERFPLEINQAGKEELIRVPGIGPISAKRIVRKRERGPFRDFSSLNEMGVVLKRALPFITVNGKTENKEQLSLSL